MWDMVPKHCAGGEQCNPPPCLGTTSSASLWCGVRKTGWEKQLSWGIPSAKGVSSPLGFGCSKISWILFLYFFVNDFPSNLAPVEPPKEQQ